MSPMYKHNDMAQICALKGSTATLIQDCLHMSSWVFTVADTCNIIAEAHISYSTLSKSRAIQTICKLNIWSGCGPFASNWYDQGGGHGNLHIKHALTHSHLYFISTILLSFVELLLHWKQHLRHFDVFLTTKLQQLQPLQPAAIRNSWIYCNHRGKNYPNKLFKWLGWAISIKVGQHAFNTPEKSVAISKQYTFMYSTLSV